MLGFVVADIIPSMAVPFFFMTSGYFYLSRVGQNSKLCVKYIKGLLFKYTIWSLPYICIRVLQMVIYENLFGIIKNCCREFFIEGSFYHFWFFPALIISVLLSTLLFCYKKLMISLSICFYIFGVVGCAYKKLAVKIGLLNLLLKLKWMPQTLMFFLVVFISSLCGFFLQRINIKKVRDLIS